ncbi:MAG: tryptophan synthase subunit alpha [Planctomycetes bacterium]|nr:tryptophan synthase subunit alpha [Planctomycetota bacterium]
MKTYRDIFNSDGKSALIPFFVLGDPDDETSFELIRTAIDAGADCLELGIPFSDPIADGPTIQRANIRALAKGMNCDRAFEIIKRVKAYRDIPIGLLMYYNLITHYGVDDFYKAAAQAGVNSVLVADLCIDDADELTHAIQANGLDTVFMVTPNTTPARQQRIAELCSGFIYTVSLLGVTGARRNLNEQVKPLIQSLKT